MISFNLHFISFNITSKGVAKFKPVLFSVALWIPKIKLLLYLFIKGEPEEPPKVEALCFIKSFLAIIILPREKDKFPFGYCNILII